MAYKKTLYQEYKVQIQKNSSETISTIITESTQTSRVLNYIMLFITSSIIFLSVLLTLFIINYKVASIAILVFGSSYLLIAKLSKNKLVKNTLKIIASTVVMSSVLVFALEKCSGYLDYEYAYKSIYLLSIVVFVGIVYLLSCYLLGLLKIKNYKTF